MYNPLINDLNSFIQLWTTIRIAIWAISAFKKAIVHKQKDTPKDDNDGILISLAGSNENIAQNSTTNNMLLPLETASVGTASDGGYSSGLLSTEDLTRQHPVAGGGTSSHIISINNACVRE